LKAVHIKSHGDRNVLEWGEIQEPICTDNTVKVKMKAASINHLDIWVRGGLPGIPIPLPLITGSDGAGVISEVGKNITQYKVGDEVVIQPGTFCKTCAYCLNGQENYCKKYGILGETENGVQAEYVVLSTENIALKAPHLTFEEASSMQLVFMTAYQMLITRAKLQKGETVLIYGATSGVGSAAIQIAKDCGAHVLTTVGSKNKIAHAEKMGADFTVLHSEADWHKQIQNYLDKTKIHVIFEHIGPSTWKQTMRLLAKGGRVVTCGATTGPSVDIDLRHLFMKQQTILGSTMSDLKSFHAMLKKIYEKKYFPFVDKIFKMSDVQKAHKRIENREQIGKVVLVP